MNLNTQYVFDGKLKRNLMIGMALGVLCLVWSAMSDDEYHTRFWTNYLHNSVYFTGIAFTAMFFMCAQITAFAGWMTAVKRVWEAMSQFMLIGIVLLLAIVVGVWGHFHHLYHWSVPGITDPTNVLYDKIIAGKSGFLSPAFFTFGTVGILAIWYFWAYKLRQSSVQQDDHETASFDYYKKQRKWAATFLPLGGFLSTVFLWELMMSIDPHWYSTMFAWYSTISVFLGGLSLMILLILYLQSKGYMEYVSREHLHDLGKYLFGISVFWTYLWFDQFMLIWYANIGEETIYFKERMANYPVLFWGNLLLNFVTPFLILMRNDNKRKVGTMAFVCIIVFFGHWWDFFYMIKPGARIAAHESREISEGKLNKHTEAAPMPGAVETQPAAPDETTVSDTLVGEPTAESHEMQSEHGQTAATHDDHAESDHADHGDAHHDDGLTSFKLGYTIPGFQEIGVMIGFLSLFLFFFFRQLERAPLLPRKDPFLEESLHHATGAYIPEEGGDEHGHH
ncbi:MAG: hypothetical protein ACKVU2_13690 [Saprospiraceae bacterium]